MERVVVVDRRETGGSDDSGHRTRPLRWESVRDRWLSPSQRDQWAVNMASSRRFGLALAVVIAVLVVQPLRPFVGVGVFLLAAVMCLIARQLLEVTRQIRLLNEANVGAGGELWGLLGLIGKPGRLLPRLGGAGMDLGGICVDGPGHPNAARDRRRARTRCVDGPPWIGRRLVHRDNGHLVA